MSAISVLSSEFTIKRSEGFDISLCSYASYLLSSGCFKNLAHSTSFRACPELAEGTGFEGWVVELIIDY